MMPGSRGNAPDFLHHLIRLATAFIVMEATKKERSAEFEHTDGPSVVDRLMSSICAAWVYAAKRQRVRAHEPMRNLSMAACRIAKRIKMICDLRGF